MNDPLAIYLHDHLAGSHFAIELLKSMQKQFADQDLGAFAAALIPEIEKDQNTLQELVDHVGTAHLDLTEAAGWVVEKASRLKLKGDDSGKGLGTFEALETLSLGIRGKLALWQVLPAIHGVDSRIPELDFEKLSARAEEQFAMVEKRRLQLAAITFRRTAE